MDPTPLIEAFELMLKPDNTLIKQGHARVKEICKNPASYPALLAICGNANISDGVRIAAASCLKTLVEENWAKIPGDETALGEPRNPHAVSEQPIPDDIKAHLRGRFLAAIKDSVEKPAVWETLEVAFFKVVALDFPESWPDLLFELKAVLEKPAAAGPQAVFAAMLGTKCLISAYELLVKPTDREPLENILHNLFPPLLAIAEEAVPLATTYPIQAGTESQHVMASRMIKFCLGSWESSMLVSLPGYISESNLKTLITFLFKILSAPLPPGAGPDSQPEDFRIIGLQKAALRIGAKLFLYGRSPKQTFSKSPQLLQSIMWFLNSQTPQLLNLGLANITKHAQLPSSIALWSVRMVISALKTNQGVEALGRSVGVIVLKNVIPLLCPSAERMSEFTTDSQEFLLSDEYRQSGMGAGSESGRDADMLANDAMNLLRYVSTLEVADQGQLVSILNTLHAYLQEKGVGPNGLGTANMQEVIGITECMLALHSVVADEEDTPDSCNNILKNNLLPLLFCQQVTNPYLKYKLIMVLKSYLLVLDQEVLVPYCSPANGEVKIIALLVAPVLQAWQTDNATLPLPLTFAVLVLLPQLLSAVESLKSSVAPGLSQLVGCYLDFINKVESESIIDALQQLTVCLKNDIQPHLLSIISTLCAQWQKANSAQTAAGVEKKTDTRSMVLGSIKSLLKAVDKIPADLGESIATLLIQHIAVPIFSVVPQDDEKLDADDVLVILNLVMHRSKSCPPSIEQFFPVISACLGPHQAQSIQFGPHEIPLLRWTKDPLSLETAQGFLMNFVKYSTASGPTLLRVLENVAHGFNNARLLNHEHEISAGTAILSAIIENKSALIDAGALQTICSLVPDPKPSFAATVLAAVGDLFIGLAASNANYAQALKKVSHESKRQWIAAVILLSMNVDADWNEVWKIVETGAKRYKDKDAEAKKSETATPDTTDMEEDSAFKAKLGLLPDEDDEDDEDDSDWNEDDVESEELDEAAYYDSAFDNVQPLPFLKSSLTKLKETNPAIFQNRIGYLNEESKQMLQTILES